MIKRLKKILRKVKNFVLMKPKKNNPNCRCKTCKCMNKKIVSATKEEVAAATKHGIEKYGDVLKKLADM